MSKKLNLKMLLSVIMLICCFGIFVLTGCFSSNSDDDTQQNQDTTTTQQTLTTNSALTTIKSALAVGDVDNLNPAVKFNKLGFNYEVTNITDGSSEVIDARVEYLESEISKYNAELTDTSLDLNENSYEYYENGIVYANFPDSNPSVTEIEQISSSYSTVEGYSKIFEKFFAETAVENGYLEENTIKTTTQNGYTLNIPLTLKGLFVSGMAPALSLIPENFIDSLYEEWLIEYNTLPEEERNKFSSNIIVTFEKDEIVDVKMIENGIQIVYSTEYPLEGDPITTTTYSTVTFKLELSKYIGEIETPQWVSDYISSQETEQIA